jgi:hypothetical protein
MMGTVDLSVYIAERDGVASDGAHRLYDAAGFTAEAEGFRLYLDRWQVPS